MTARREASQAPLIAGHRFVKVLGLGGFADVFLYEQEMPRRPVAVKVLLAGTLDHDLRTRFQTEANVMAQLSHHPSIVTIFHADIAGDGRPYLVMEYCSGPGLAERYRTERMTVAESLRIGVRLGSAVETAHRAGILHRDIKPANVLTTDFGWPALTDFGIAATPGAGAGAAVGMSIPWSPPELLAARPTGDERSDVFSLAATIYSLLAGRTPFELPGGRNGAADLVGRIERGQLSSISREDVPAELQGVLARAMDTDPDRRYATAAAFARALQHVEAELGLAVTPLDLNDDVRGSGVLRSGTGSRPVAPSLSGEGDESEQSTRLRPVLAVEPSASRPAHDASSTRGAVLPSQRSRPGTGVGRTTHRAAERTPGESAERSGGTRGSRQRSLRIAASAAAIVVLAVVVVAAVLTIAAPDDSPELPPTGELVAPTSGGVAEVVPAPTDLVGTREPDGSVVFTWSNPDTQSGDRYLWGVLTATGDPVLALVEIERVEVPAGTGEPVCIEVSIVRADRSASPRPAEACAP